MNLKNHTQRAERVLARINELAAVTEEKGVITRTYGTDAFVSGRNLIAQWMQLAGLQVHIDNIGNVRGRFTADENEKTFVIGSHIDSVVGAGKFDGPLGVIAGIEIAERFIQSAQPTFNVEVIGFCDEEGVRFGTTFLGSNSIAGSFDPNLLDKTDNADISLRAAIKTIGGDAVKISTDSLPKEKWLGYYEIHIEQGPVLYNKNLPVAIVSAIAAQIRVQLIFTGFAGHAGTIPMNMRQDALAAASEFVIAVEKYGIQHKDKLVATVGKMDIPHSATNVIPGKAICTLDIRSKDEKLLEEAVNSLKQITEEISNRRKLQLEWSTMLQTKPVFCDERLKSFLSESITKAGYEKIELTSGAGHDAVTISQVAPVSMLFVKCFKGISHNPLENAELEDITAAIAVSDNYLNLLNSNYK